MKKINLLKKATPKVTLNVQKGPSVIVEKAVRGVRGADGRDLELRNHENSIQWKYIEETNWNHLASLSELSPQDGQSVQLRVDDFKIQWKLENETVWENLLDLQEVRGEDGAEIVSVHINEKDFVFHKSDGTDATLIGAVDQLKGPAGPGVPQGGQTGQVLSKIGDLDYQSEWKDMDKESFLAEEFVIDQQVLDQQYVQIKGEILDNQTVLVFIDDAGLKAEEAADYSLSGNQVYWAGYRLDGLLELGDTLKIIYRGKEAK